MNEKKIKAQLSKDSTLKKIVINLDPLYLEPSGSVYHELIKSIVYQQISYKAADVIYARFLHLFPKLDYHPEELLEIPFEILRSVGLSNQKTNYIQNISHFFIEEKLLSVQWENYSDKEIIELLTQIKGVGIWTVKMILIFELIRPDVFPHEDLAIRLVITDLYGLKSEKKELKTQMLKIAESWKPFRTMASLYLWAYRRSQI